MARRLSLIDNKVARRITVSFIFGALIPIVIFGLLSYYQVGEQLREQTAKFLHKSCKDYTIRLIDRLSLFESSLYLLTNKVEKFGKEYRLITKESEHNLTDQFASLAVVTPNGGKYPLLGETSFIPELTGQEIQEISSGKTLLKPTSESDGNRLWMAVGLVKNHTEAGLLMAELKPQQIWEAENFEPNDLWVMGEGNRLLFASRQDFDLPPNVKLQISRANSGQLTLKLGDHSYVAAFRNLPVKSMFASAEMVIVQAQPEALAFETIKQFGELYPPVIALAILLVAFFITQLVIKYLSPLEQLKAATLKIAEGNFSTKVNISSHDEFEELADSFNEMTRRLSSQFDILSTMAEIDRHILSSLNADDIVETALSRLPSILFCDLISIAKVDPETYRVSNIHTQRSGQGIETLTEPIKLSLQDTLDLLAMQDSVIETDNKSKKFSTYLQVLGDLGSWRYLIVPIIVNGTLSSMICIGYKGQNPIPNEARAAARNFGDRIAVALSNAAWEGKLYQQAHYDALTGLPNRLVLNDRLAQELARARRGNSQLAVIFIDLDRFKNVNDSLGHAAGDELLVQVSKVFVNCVRETDLVVRIGGDEFVVVITELHEHLNPMSLVRGIAEKILTSLNQSFIIAGHPMTFTASLGIAVFPTDADNAPNLLKNADAAMYSAKNEGRANFRFYSSELNANALENIRLEQELRGAIVRGEIHIYYQPKVNLVGRIVGAEALIRWKHTELGMVSPAKFIPIAEQSGMIVEIGEWVLVQTCLWVKSFYNSDLDPFRISVNLSAVEFKRPELVGRVAEILRITGVNPSLIELELTESIAIGDSKIVIERMNALKALGLTISMDDFGTGFSSLSYLKELPLDVLKIDQSFVAQLETDLSSQAIVKAILALANGLGMKAVAEGVETKGQLEFLKQNQCGIFQGYLFSRPVPKEDFLRLLITDPISE
jgi:diguanylate cyclase (GGDEF)-like protein